MIHWIQTLLEPEHFPAWEAYLLFMLLFFVSITFRLARIEKKLEKL